MSNETADVRWRPILGVEAVLLSVISMLNDPNINSPANIDASVQYRDNREAYNAKVRRMAQRAADYIWNPVAEAPFAERATLLNKVIVAMLGALQTTGFWSTEA